MRKPNRTEQVLILVTVLLLLVTVAAIFVLNSRSQAVKVAEVKTKQSEGELTKAREAVTGAEKRAKAAEDANAELKKGATDSVQVSLNDHLKQILAIPGSTGAFRLSIEAHKPSLIPDGELIVFSTGSTPTPANGAPAVSTLSRKSMWELLDDNMKRIAEADGIKPDSIRPSDFRIIKSAQQREEAENLAKKNQADADAWKQKADTAQKTAANLQAKATADQANQQQAKTAATINAAEARAIEAEAKTEALKAAVEASRNKVNGLQAELEAARSMKAKAGDGKLEKLEAAVEEARKEAEQLKVKLDASEAIRAKLEATLKAVSPSAASPPAPAPAPALPSAADAGPSGP